MKLFSILFISILIGNIMMAQIPELPEKPSFQTSVYDEAGLLNPEQKSTLEQKLIQYADSTSTQIVIATINTTNGEEIGYYATHWAHKWGIGQADKDNGVLILVAKDDRKMTIRTGYGIEHMLTDALSRRIIENVMKPRFRDGDYYGGLDEATNVMFQIFAGEYKNEATKEEGSIFPFIIVLIIFIIFIIIIAKASKNSGGNGGRNTLDHDLFGPIILSRTGRGNWGGGFGGGSSGGGFGGGFGGGGFGGGGASGGW